MRPPGLEETARVSCVSRFKWSSWLQFVKLSILSTQQNFRTGIELISDLYTGNFWGWV